MLASLLLLSLPLLSFSHNSLPNHRVQNQKRLNGHLKANRAQSSFGNATTETEHRLMKRSYSGEATYFAPGLGACGTTSSATDYIVALNSAQYGSGVSPYCFQTISITYGSKTHEAEIVDECPGCGEYGLDMSPSLFEYFADLSVGVFYMEWSVVGSGGSDGGGDSGSSTTTTTTKKTTYTTTTTYNPPTTTTTTTYDQPTTTTTTDYPTTTTTTDYPTTTTTTTTYSSSSSSQDSSSSTSSSSSSSSSSLNSTSILPTSSLNATSTSSLNSTSASINSTSATSTSSTSVPTITSDFATGNLNYLSQVFLGVSGLIVAAANEA